jgi:large subunit ribosomal protein L15
MPLTRRVPKYGFTPRNRVETQVVNVDRLDKLVAEKKIEGAVITPEVLYKAGVISKKNVPVKVLGTGELSAKLEISAHAFSKTAKEKIESAGGRAIILS